MPNSPPLPSRCVPSAGPLVHKKTPRELVFHQVVGGSGFKSKRLNKPSRHAGRNVMELATSVSTGIPSGVAQHSFSMLFVHLLIRAESTCIIEPLDDKDKALLREHVESLRRVGCISAALRRLSQIPWIRNDMSMAYVFELLAENELLDIFSYCISMQAGKENENCKIHRHNAIYISKNSRLVRFPEGRREFMFFLCLVGEWDTAARFIEKVALKDCTKHSGIVKILSQQPQGTRGATLWNQIKQAEDYHPPTHMPFKPVPKSLREIASTRIFF